jgi:hypothetical protein
LNRIVVPPQNGLPCPSIAGISIAEGGPWDREALDVRGFLRLCSNEPGLEDLSHRAAFHRDSPAPRLALSRREWLPAVAWQEVDEYEEGRQMPFVTSFERYGMLRILEASLRTKFGEEGTALIPVIHELDDAEKYLALNPVIINATTLEEVRRACAKLAAPARRRKKEGNGKRASSKP